MFLLPYEGTHPTIAGEPRAALPGHAVVGRVTIGRDAWLGAGTIIRADGHVVEIGDGLHMGRGATIHIAHDVYPTIAGHRVVIGIDSVVHACTVGDDVVVEDGSVILDGAVVGAGTVIEGGSIVYPRNRLEPGMVYAGRPAKPVRVLGRDELAARAQAQRDRNQAADAAWSCRATASQAAADAYVADTCDLAGDVRVADGASIWFGCRLDGRAGPIVVASRANVQDNSVLVAGPEGLSIGEDTTIGHNVQLADCHVGARCLVGMGSRIAAGTTIADDTFVAGGTVTEPGQRLDGGLVWGGHPAKPIGKLDDGKRDAIMTTAVIYGQYAASMRAATRSG